MNGRLAYSNECQLLRAAAELLRFPQPVIATSLTFLHRYYRACPEASKKQEIAPACLFLASKVEEASVRINDLVNAFLYLENPVDTATVQSSFPGLGSSAAAGAAAGAAEAHAGDQGAADRLTAAPEGEAVAAAASRAAVTAAGGQQPAKLLVGDAYYTAKDQLIHREQVLLRWLGFELCIDHPYRYLLNFANVTGCSAPLVRLGLSLVNDSLLHTDLSAWQPPADIAAGALQLASLLLGEPPATGEPAGLRWVEMVGLRPAAVDAVGRELLVSLEAADAAAYRPS